MWEELRGRLRHCRTHGSEKKSLRHRNPRSSEDLSWEAEVPVALSRALRCEMLNYDERSELVWRVDENPMGCYGA